MGKQTNAQPDEVLPLGVGRVPAWWMEITPHYTLDLEEQEARRGVEDQMAFYYAQMAAADDAGMLDANGKPKLGPDGKPLTWGNNGWAGRSANSNGDGGAGGVVGPGGRTFAPGTAVINPAMFGIGKSDPDYQNYLTGAKLPPGYLEKMAEFAAQYHANNSGESSGMANNLAQTDYGRYGRQAENPAFKPAWAKLKLRSTAHGSALRYGIDASPEKTARRVVENDKLTVATPAPPLESAAEPQRAPAPAPVAAPVAQAQVEAPPKQKKMVRKVRKVRRKPRGPPKAPVAVEEEKKEAYIPKTYEQYSHSDYYYNAKAGEQPAKPAQHYDEEEYEEEIIEEDNDEYEYEEEIIEDEYEEPPQASVDLNDLQAILAAKQAELMRLQAQM